MSLVLIHGHPTDTTKAALTIFSLETGGHWELQLVVENGWKIVLTLLASLLGTEGNAATFADNSWQQGWIIVVMVVFPYQHKDIIVDVDQALLLP